MGDCFVCSKHRGEIEVPGGAAFEDDLVYVGHVAGTDDASTYLGWFMIDTKRHVAGLPDLTDEEAQAVGRFGRDVARHLLTVERAEHVYAFVLGDEVPHFHAHIVPRYHGAPREFWGTRVRDWAEAPRGGPEAVAQATERLRATLSSGRY